MNEWMNEWMNEKNKGWDGKKEWMNEWMNEWTNVVFIFHEYKTLLLEINEKWKKLPLFQKIVFINEVGRSSKVLYS